MAFRPTKSDLCLVFDLVHFYILNRWICYLIHQHPWKNGPFRLKHAHMHIVCPLAFDPQNTMLVFMNWFCKNLILKLSFPLRVKRKKPFVKKNGSFINLITKIKKKIHTTIEKKVLFDQKKTVCSIYPRQSILLWRSYNVFV